MKLISSFILTTSLAFSAINAYAAPLTFTLSESKQGTTTQVTEESYKDQYLFVAIGYTSCPEICPTTALDMAGVMHRLGNKADLVTPLFISIDPNRDTADNLAQYVQYFHPKLVGLVGNEEQTKAVAKSLRATYGYSRDGKPVYAPLPELYEVFHSTYLYLYGPDRELIDVYGYGDGSEKIAKAMLKELPEK
ncbi:SCO family protein [Vibrio alfacsensis]|uniref:SCO family protein n=1 Tax=Vibrio alfacsensis TaxID=1074311 RepID=A0ABN5PJB5_9VIBR|nr:SCO family protein [Vibrio alfacsensis]AXY02452.1 SCO family protein [Vibrio alfacsensis]